MPFLLHISVHNALIQGYSSHRAVPPLWPLLNEIQFPKMLDCGSHDLGLKSHPERQEIGSFLSHVSAMDYTLSSGDSMSRDFKGTYAGEGTDLTLKWEGAGQTRVTIEGSTLSMNNEGMLFTYKK